MEKYSSDFKHFDNLIWQLPVWSSAIFLLAVTSVSYVSNTGFNELVESEELAKKLPLIFSTTTLIVCCIFQAVIFNALVRFRDHQAETVDSKKNSFAPWWRSGQTWLQVAVIAQFCALLYMTLILYIEIYALLISLFAAILMFLYTYISYKWKHKSETSNSSEN